MKHKCVESSKKEALGHHKVRGDRHIHKDTSAYGVPDPLLKVSALSEAFGNSTSIDLNLRLHHDSYK